MNRFFLMLLLTFGALEAAPLKKVRVGVIADSGDYGFVRLGEWFQAELSALLEGEFDVEFAEEHYFQGDWSPEKIQHGIDLALNNPEIDVVVGLGLISCQKLAMQKELSKPCFAPVVMRHQIRKLPHENGASGIHNLNYLTFPTNLERDFRELQKITPFKKLTVLAHGPVVKELDILEDLLGEIQQELNLDIQLTFVSDSIDETLMKIPNDTEAVYIMPLPQFDQDQLERLAEGLIKKKIPGYSIFSERYLEAGFLASLSSDSDFPRMIRRTALNIQRALLGEDPGSLPVKVSETEQLTINMKAARELGVSPSWDILDKATFVNFDYTPTGLEFDLVGAITVALESNLYLAAARKEVAIGREDVSLSRSNLFPHVDVGGYWRKIDKDRALGSLGLLREGEVCSVAAIRQVLCSNELFGDYRIQKYLQGARNYGYESDSLDTVLKVSEVYFNLLRAQTLLGIHYKNLERTKSHLKLARQRVSVGVANSSEVYRWESQHATDMTNVLQAKYDVRTIVAQLKRTLSISQTEEISVKEVDLDENFWAKKKDWLIEHVYNDWTLEMLINFSVMDGLVQSSEIKEVQYAICAQAEAVGVAKRAYWLPDVFLTYDLEDCFSRSGARSPMRAPFNSTDWSVGVNVSFPLYSGGAKSARRRRSCKELQRLQIELDSLIEKKEECIRVSIYGAANSYSAAGLSEQSAGTAHENLNLVQDGYSKGVMSIVDMIDAQNQALVADLVTANAVYDFLIDLMRVQRNIGRFDFLMADNEMDNWIHEITDYFNKKERR